MLFTKDMVNLRIYKRPIFLPTLENNNQPDKKNKSIIFLLTPSRSSSIGLINSKLTINKMRYQSYYLEKDLTYFINSKVLAADNLDESAYITESSVENDFNVSGFDKDVKQITDGLDAGVYHCMVNDLGCYESFPVMNVVVGNFPERRNFFEMRFSNYDGKDIITVEVPRNEANESPTTYTFRIINFMFKALIINKFRDTVNTAIPNIVADSFTHVESREGDWGRYLFWGELDSENQNILKPEDKVNYNTIVIPNIKEFWENVSGGNYRAILNRINEKFPEVRITDLAYENPGYMSEASTPITMTNLGDKFKYATSTKFKRKFSTKINTIKRVLDKLQINFGASMEMPAMNIPSMGSSERATVENALSGLIENEDYFMLDENHVLFLNEAGKYDLQLKKLLFADRIRNLNLITKMNKEIKAACPDIKYTFNSLDRYNKKNLFIDLYYYNQTFFKNNTWQQKKGFDLYLDMLNRLINDSRLNSLGYEKKTIFIPIKDWDTTNTARMWLYRENINPVSILYELMMKDPGRVKSVFKNVDIIFFGNSSIFKMNFMQFKDNTEIKKMGNKFRNFVIKIIQNAPFEATDVDVDTSTKMSPEAIKADLYDRFEASQGIDLTGKDKPNPSEEKGKKDLAKKRNISVDALDGWGGSFYGSKADKEQEKEIPENISKGADPVEKEEMDEDLKKLAQQFAKYADKMPDTDSAIDSMEDDYDLKKIIRDIDASQDPGIKISTTRAARFNTLSYNLLDKKIEDRTIKDILATNQSTKKIEETKLDIATPNDDWNNLTYLNFDKKYDLDADIVACFNHFTTTSLPMGIREITAEDNSTSEDRLKLYTVKYEDFNGKRHTVRLDIPIHKDNRFLLRGNNKVIATQFLNMPILKTDLGTAQVITNYQKIYVRRFNEALGRSLPVTSQFIKAMQKYKGNAMKISFGDNKRICNKYQLPIDYIDIASYINSIEIPDKSIKIYFNQDEIRDEYGDIIKENLGVPYLVNTKDKRVIYYNEMSIDFTTQLLNDILGSGKVENIFELVSNEKSSTSGTYTRCKILGTLIPLVIVVAYVDGLDNVLNKAGISFNWKEKIERTDRDDTNVDWIKFSDGYLVYRITYSSSLLLNGLKDCPTDMYSIADANDKKMYIEFLDNFGGRIKADGIDNFNDCLIDPITKEVMEYYGLPTSFVEVLLYTNNLLADNKFIKHTDTSSRRIRRAEMIAAYTYEALSEAYAMWANQIRHGRKDAEFKIRQSEVIDKLMASPISQDDSINNALGAIEETNNISFKGKAGLNKDRAYSLDKRTYDDSMLNVLGASTAFSANVGIGRASTINLNVDNVRGYIKQIDSDTTKMNTANSLTATEAMIPFEVNRDDNTRVSMSFVQTAKHQVRTNKSDPLLVTSGIDEAIPYLTTDTFAYKAKEDGSVVDITDEYMIIEYKSGKREYVSLKEEIKKNSDGGYFIPVKLDAKTGIKAGKKFKANEIIAFDSKSFSNSVGESDNIAYGAGDLAKVAIINTDEGFEDSGVCIESLAKDLTTQVIYNFPHMIERDAIIYNFKKVGDYVNVGDALFVWQDSYEDEDANILLRIMGQENIEASELGRKVIRSETTGTVVGIKVYRTCELSEMSPSVEKFVKAYEAPIKELKKTLEANNITTEELPATYSLPAVGKLKKADDALYIEYFVQHDDIVGIGDKIVYFAANKAVIRNVIPNELAPYTDYRPNEPVSAFVSVVSINKRMVTSTIVTGTLNKLMVELDRKCKEKAGIPFDDSKV